MAIGMRNAGWALVLAASVASLALAAPPPQEDADFAAAIAEPAAEAPPATTTAAEAPPPLASIPVQPVPPAAEVSTAASKRKGKGLSIEEIVVTAQRQEEGINSVLIAITAFAGDALAQLDVTDTRDLGNVIPGLSVSNAGFNKPVYTLRGIGFNETSQTASSTVGVYLDETSFPFDIITKGANLDIARVEVLKGPKRTLHSRNTTGGAINYVSNKPTDTFQGGITGSFGNFLTTDVDGFVSDPLTDTVKACFAVRSQQGWQHSNTRPDDRSARSPRCWSKPFRVASPSTTS